MRPLPLPRRTRSAILALAATALLALATAPVAQAEPAWNFGVSQSSTTVDCFSGTIVSGVGAYNAVWTDRDNPHAVGEPFGLAINAMSLGHPCGEPQWAGMYLDLPSGVTLAPGLDPICFKGNYNTGLSTQFTAGCPTSVIATSDGILVPSPYAAGYWPLAMDRRDNSLVQSIDFDNSPYVDATGVWVEVQLPLVSSRAFQNEMLRTPVHVIDSVLNPWLSNITVLMSVAPGRGASIPPTAPADDGVENLFNAPKSMRISKLLRGYRLTVNLPHPDTTLTITWKGKIGRRTVTFVKVVRKRQSGRVRLRLKPSRKMAAKLKRVKRVKSTLRVSARTSFGPHTDVDTARVALRR